MPQVTQSAYVKDPGYSSMKTAEKPTKDGNQEEES